MSRGVVGAVVAAGVLVLAGGGLVVFSAPVSFGWFAYAPLSSQDLPQGLGEAVVLTRQQAVGGVVVAAGVALAAAVVGYLIGRRRPVRA